MIPLLVLAAIPLVVVVLVFGLRSPLGVLVAGYAFIVPFGSAIDLPIPLPPPFNTVSSLAGLAAVAGMFLHLLLVRRGPVRVPSAAPIWLLFLCLAGLTFAWSVDGARTIDDLMVVVSLVALYVLTALMPVSTPHAQRICTAIMTGAVVASVIGIVLVVGGHAPIGKSGVPRFLITGDDPNHTAAGLLLPLMLAMSRSVDRRQSPPARAFAVGGVVVMATGIVLTGSRGGVLAALTGTLVVMAHTGSTKRAGSVVIVLGLAVLLGLRQAPEKLQDRLVARTSTGRTDIWQLGLATCPRYCFVGSGFGTFPAVYQKEFRTNPEGGGYRTAAFRAHNIWLQALIEIGIAGLVLLVLGFAATVREVARLPREDRGPPLAALLALAVASSLLSNLTFKYFWLVLMYSVIVVSAAGRTESERGTLPVGRMH